MRATAIIANTSHFMGVPKASEVRASPNSLTWRLSDGNARRFSDGAPARAVEKQA